MHREAKYVGVLTTDVELRVRGWDPWLVEATGLHEDDVHDRSLVELFPEIEARGLLPRLRRVLDDGAVEVLAPAFHHYLIRCPAPGAQPHFDAMQQHVSISPLRSHGTITGLVITIEDVTARCVKERELAAQLKSQDEAIRMRAARLLSQDATDPTPLLDAMDDRSWQVRKAAVHGVSRSTEDQVLERLIEAVRDQHEDISLLNSALSALALSKLDAVPHLTKLLTNEHANVRMYTALALGNLQDARAVPALLPLLEDEDVNVRYHVIEALGRIRAREGATALLPILEAKDPFLSFAALDAIGSIGERSVAPAVQALIADEMLAVSAVEALGSIGDEQSAAALARLLDADTVPVATICRALAAIYRRLDEEYGEGALVGDVVRGEVSADVVVQLSSAIPSANDDDLVAIARVLGWLGYDGVDDALAGLLRHPRARKVAIEGLVKRGLRATQALMRELRNEEPEVRRTAVHALGRIGDRRALDALIDALQTDDAALVITAAGALGSIGDRRAFDALVGLLSHDDAAVRQAAVSAINSIGHPETGPRVRELLNSPNEHVRESAVRIAGYFGDAESFELVLKLLADPAEGVRRTAVEHLGYFEDARVLPALAAALKGKSAAVRAVAARALAHVDEESALPHLSKAVVDNDPRVRYQAVKSAAMHRIPELAPTLREIARSDSAIPVRIAAVRALGELRDTAATPLLIELAMHPETDIASVAIVALGQLPGPAAAAALHRALYSEDARRQRAALDAADGVHLHALLPQLERLAESADDADSARTAINLLARSGDDGALARLLELSTDPLRRADVIAALARVDELHEARVSEGLRHRDARVRSAVVESLARMKRSSASRALGTALADPDPAVRFATEQALGRLDLSTRSTRSR